MQLSAFISIISMCCENLHTLMLIYRYRIHRENYNFRHKMVISATNYQVYVKHEAELILELRGNVRQFLFLPISMNFASKF